MDYTIAESYTLPSKGLVYEDPINPVVKLRSMTVQDEMKRLSHSDTQYKTMCDLIESCIVGDKPAISVYDMCLGDYQFLMHKLRIVTYGPEYNLVLRCQMCGELNDHTVDLDKIEVHECPDNYDEFKKVMLPVAKKEVLLKMQTPRILDTIIERTKELKKKLKDSTDELGLLVTLESTIDKVDGQKLNPVQLENFVRNMNMKDANLLVQKMTELNSKVGLDNKVVAKCKNCGYEVVTRFRITDEFFGPSSH